MAAHPLAGSLSVEESAKLIRHYRYAEERMMRIMGGWIALTPELSAKLLLGRRVWECAQHADLWGKRLPELRAPAQVSEPPTRRILERTAEEERGHTAAGQAVLSHLLEAREAAEGARRWRERLDALLVDAGGVTGRGAGAFRVRDLAPDPGGVAQELVELERPTGEWPILPELKASLDTHVRHLQRREYGALDQDFDPGYRERGMTVYRALPSTGFVSYRIVGFAKLGGQRVVKLLLKGPTAGAILQLRWGSRDGHWEVLEAEVVRSRETSGS